MDWTDGIIKYKIIPSQVVNWTNIKKTKTLMQNDLYEKHQIEVLINGEMLVCNDISKMKVYNKQIKRETYQDYLKKLENRDPEKDKWIYNIINGSSEQESILYQDDFCIIIPSYTWSGYNIESGSFDKLDKLHILCFPQDLTLRCIRSLESKHIELLKHMKEKSCQIIKEKYGIDESELKMFFHYDPSTYHLHIHFVNVEFTECNSSVEYSHELNNVIFNIGLDSDYYKKIILNTR